MSRAFDALPLEEQNRLRAVYRVAKREAMAHVGRELERALAPFPEEGPVTVDAGWLRDFAGRWQEDGYHTHVHTDYIAHRAFRALDEKEPAR